MEMKFFVEEITTLKSGDVAAAITQKNTEEEAISAFHQVMASAIINPDVEAVFARAINNVGGEYGRDYWKNTVVPEEAPNDGEYVTIDWEKGIPVGLNGKKMDALSLLNELNVIGGRNGVGLVDICENRFVGMKSRGVYETPGGAILYYAHRMMDHICLDKETYHFKQHVSLRMADLIYEGKWFTTLMDSCMAFIDKAEENVTGWSKVKVVKGAVRGAGSGSKYSLYNESIASFTTGELYNHKDAQGFITLAGLPLKVRAMMEQQVGEGQAITESKNLKKRPTE